jgi:hypothetical protein
LTTGQIENAANAGGISTPDFPLKTILRYSVIPRFLIDVGDTQWRRRTGSIATVAGTSDYALPANFMRMRQIGAHNPGLLYVGEDDARVLELEASTDQGKPHSWRIIASSDNSLKTLRLYPTPDAPATIPYSYSAYIPFASEMEEIDLAPYIPEEFHWALVEGLRAEILNDRFGEGDNRYMRAEGQYQQWLARANRMDNREPGPRSHMVYAR